VHEHYAIVPSADRTQILTVDGRLPVVRTEKREQPGVPAALRATYGVRAPFLRVVSRLEDEDRQLTTLFEVDSAPEGWSPSAPAAWLPLGSVNPEEMAPLFAAGLEGWLAEQRGAPVPPQRASWARPGWLAAVTAWVDEVAGVTTEPRLVRVWPLSAMYVFETELGSLYLKGCFALWPHEPAVTAALAREHPDSTPEVVAIDERKGWLLMHEVTGEQVADLGAEATEQELRVAATIQRATVGKHAELLEVGMPHRPLDELRAAAPHLGGVCERLEALGLPETLTHGDLHQWNAIRRDGAVVLLDWSDAALAHPFLDLAPMLFYAEPTAEEREQFIRAYLQPWAGIAPEADLREAAALGETLGCVYQAISFRAIHEAFEPADRWLFGGEWDRWTARAVELAERL
jgi:hypothetical protein